MISHSMQERSEKGECKMIRFVMKIFAILGLIVLSALLLLVKLAEKVSGMVFGIIFVPFVLMVTLAVLTSDWFAVGVFVLIVGTVLICFILVATLEFTIADGRNYLRSLICRKA